jgi:hypothetical protein
LGPIFFLISRALHLRVGKSRRSWFGAALSSPGASVGSANVTPTELANAIAVLADPALVELLDASSPPCVPPTDIFESMKLVEGGVRHQNSTTMCDNPPVKAARDVIYQLGDKYLPPPTR